MKQTINVNEIFYSIEGEGKRAGAACVFVRTHGCNLDCRYCDTQYAKTNDGILMNIEDVLKQIEQYKCKNVTLTGGEPLNQLNTVLLIGALIKRGYEVNIETNGSIPLDFFDRYDGKLFFTIDWKTTCSGETKAMHRKNLLQLKPSDVLKFVVGSKEDLEEAKEIISYLPTSPEIFISPVFGKIKTIDIVDYIKAEGLPARVQIQLHKYIWGENGKGV